MTTAVQAPADARGVLSEALAAFRPVPGGRYEVEGSTTRLSCSCGHASELSTGQLRQCACRRWFLAAEDDGFTCRLPRWLELPEEDHDCRPELVWVNGAYCRADYCAHCGADIETSPTTNPKEGS